MQDKAEMARTNKTLPPGISKNFNTIANTHNPAKIFSVSFMFSKLTKRVHVYLRGFLLIYTCAITSSRIGAVASAGIRVVITAIVVIVGRIIVV